VHTVPVFKDIPDAILSACGLYLDECVCVMYQSILLTFRRIMYTGTWYLDDLAARMHRHWSYLPHLPDFLLSVFIIS
jgi:hypothetical protein